jgi:hypothetical protein
MANQLLTAADIIAEVQCTVTITTVTEYSPSCQPLAVPDGTQAFKLPCHGKACQRMVRQAL